MKKKFMAVLALALCLAIAIPVAASDFVPSITYKGGPKTSDIQVTDVNGVVLEGWEGVDGCVVVTTIQEAIDKTTDISQEDRDLLLEVYEKLDKVEMTLPIEEDHVIRELLDVSFEYADCRLKEDHGNKPLGLKEEGVLLTVKFDLDIEADVTPTVMTYIDGEWTEIVEVTNNGDGTVTCVFEDICPVAFVVPAK